MSRLSPKGVAIVLIVLANLIGGSTYMAQKQALDGLPPATVILLRNLIAMACMAGWMAARGHLGAGLLTGFTRREHGRLLLLGVFGYALPLVLGIVGLRWSSSGNGSILILLEPPAILAFAWLLLRERIRPGQLLGILVGLGGALCIVVEDAPLGGLLQADLLQGNLILAAHGILWGLYSPLMSPLARRHRALDITFLAMAYGLVLLVPATLAEHAAWSAGPALLPALGWTLALGVIASFVGTVFWTMSLRELNASVVAPFVFLQPLAGVVAGHLVLDERLSPEAALGGVLIMAGVLLVARPAARPVLPS